MTVATWVQPGPWIVPQEWDASEVCFILCSGESIGAQKRLIPQLKGRFIAVRHGVLLKPDADVLFMSGEGHGEILAGLVQKFRGTHAIVRGKHYPILPDTVKRVTRTKDHDHLCELKDHVCGYDTGTSAINLAYHFGARTIVMLGYDMTGGHFCKHPLQNPPQDHFRQHMNPLERLAQDCTAKGVRVVNCSPITKVTAFEKQPLEAFL